MKKIKKVLILFMACIAICGAMTGCGDKTPELSDKDIIALGEAAILNEVYYDKIVDFKFTEVATSEEELAKLKEAFTQSLPYKTYYVTASISSISMSANVEFNITYVYNAEWQAFYCHDVNSTNWKYIPKEDVSNKNLMADISKIKVGDFDIGYIGNDKYSSIEIKNNNFDESINRSDIDFVITATTDYGKVKINGKAIYYFQKGAWVFGDITCDDISKWEITYNNKLEFSYGADYVTQKLITKTEFLTYVANQEYYTKGELSSPVVSPLKDGVIYKYIFTTTYDGIGLVKYNVDVTFDWVGYEWGDGDFAVSVNSIDFMNLMGKTYSVGDKSLTIKSIKLASEDENYKGKDLEENDSSIDIVFSYNDGTKKTDIYTNFQVVLRDDDWGATVFKVTDSSGKDIDITTLSNIELFVSNNTIKFNNEVYTYSGQAVSTAGDNTGVTENTSRESSEVTSETSTESSSETESTSKTESSSSEQTDSSK